MNSGTQSFWKIICIVCLISLIHCAYSAAQHRSYLRLTQETFHQLPLDLVVQTLVSLIGLILSASFVAGEFQTIRSDLQNKKKSWDTFGNRPSFYIFEHRAKCLSPKFDTADF